MIQILGLAPVASALKNRAKRRFFDSFFSPFAGYGPISASTPNGRYRSRTTSDQCENNCCNVVNATLSACGTKEVNCHSCCAAALSLTCRLLQECASSSDSVSSAIIIGIFHRFSYRRIFCLLLRKLSVNRLRNRRCCPSLHLHRVVIVMHYLGC